MTTGSHPARLGVRGRDIKISRCESGFTPVQRTPWCCANDRCSPIQPFGKPIATAQMLPSTLSSRYQVLRELRPASASARGVWLVVDRASGQRSVLKCAPARALAPAQVLAHLRAYWPSEQHLLLPCEQGVIDDSVSFERTEVPFEEVSDLQALGMSAQWSTIGTRVVEQVAEALAAIHTARGGLWVLHGDIKPSNVIASRARGSEWTFHLADFDAALLVNDYATTQPRPARVTLRYASPEALGGGQLNPVADYWSLGMLVFEALLGSHPFEHWTDVQQRSAVVGAWQPDLGRIESNEWRALARGLLRRDPDTRWKRTEVEGWLRRDPAVISNGLTSREEPATSTPFNVAGIPVYSAESLARVALRHWQVVTR